MKHKVIVCAGAAALLICGCSEEAPPRACSVSNGEPSVKLITLDPGHFHAALIQKRMYPDVAAEVHVYAPNGADLDMHMERINSFNSRAENPTTWENIVYAGDDFFERMLADKSGNVVVLAGNNARKPEYILKCIEAGYNVLADKPMVINPEGFEQLKKAFAIARQKGLMLYDIMTERYEVTTALQREFSLIPEIYGTQEAGTADNPAVTKESVHHFCKLVAGKPLRRPDWFYDPLVQGESLVDVNTHLVDLVQWELFPEKVLMPSDVAVVKARVWDTPMSPAEFEESTGLKEFPAFLQKYVDGTGKLQTKANGEFTYALKGVFAKASVKWNVKAPEGTQDTHYSMMRGTKSELIIRQGAEQGYKTALYVEPREGVDTAAVEQALGAAITDLQAKYPGIASKKSAKGWQVEIPDALKAGHEAHFGQVAENYLSFLKKGEMPDWEVPNMIVKYHTLMEAYKLTR
ncbi:MAG: putative oxidoreductase C-terminal domain-containing protein [Kiritimatiellae bacterium]|nr:putative oxidoreductase C-terminal domain-containing protein [Kiritimatiellia bacterium]